MTDMQISISTGWVCLLAGVSLIGLLAMTAPKIKSWPTKPTRSRAITFCLMCALIYRGINILQNPGNKHGAIVYEAMVVGIFLMARFADELYETYRQHHAPKEIEAVETVQDLLDQSGKPGALCPSEVVIRGLMATHEAKAYVVRAPKVSKG